MYVNVCLLVCLFRSNFKRKIFDTRNTNAIAKWINKRNWKKNRREREKCRTFWRQVEKDIAQTKPTQLICEVKRHQILMINGDVDDDNWTNAKTLLIFNPNYPIYKAFFSFFSTRTLCPAEFFFSIFFANFICLWWENNVRNFFVFRIGLTSNRKCRILLKIDLNLKLSFGIQL